MELRDYNGEGIWTLENILCRYGDYCRRLSVVPAPLKPREHQDGDVLWRYPMMDEVLGLIRKGDLAAVELGVELVLDDARMAFGKLLKSRAARLLRHCRLTPVHAAALRDRFVQMLLAGQVPHEFKEYVKLLRKVGVGERWPDIEKGIDRRNRYVMRHYEYLKRHAGPENR